MMAYSDMMKSNGNSFLKLGVNIWWISMLIIQKLWESRELWESFKPLIWLWKTFKPWKNNKLSRNETQDILKYVDNPPNDWSPY